MSTTLAAISMKMAIPANQCAWPEIFAAAMAGKQTVLVPAETLNSGVHCRSELTEGGLTFTDELHTSSACDLVLGPKEMTRITWK
jgi:hypothetical protein